MNLRQLCKDKGFTLSKISEETGISLVYLSNLNTNKKNNPTKSTLEKISSTIGATVEEVINSIQCKK